jgi:ferredoxin
VNEKRLLQSEPELAGRPGSGLSNPTLSLSEYPVKVPGFREDGFLWSEVSMSTSVTRAAAETPFENFLNKCDEKTWSATIAALLPSIHEIDKSATQIWFRFYPLGLFLALTEAEETEKLAGELLLQGNYYLKDQIDSSHKFLYGHRYWPQIKQAVERHAESWFQSQSRSDQSRIQVSATSLADQILAVALDMGAALKADQSLLVGITAVAFMTVRQVGVTSFKAAPGNIHIDQKHAKKSPAQILKERAKDDSQGLLGFLKTVDKKWTVVFDENDDAAKYKLNNFQDLAWGAAEDRSRDWAALDPRRIEGPIPVECRSASCGTCWVGVLGGAEKLAPVGTREGKKIKEFGYIDTAEPKPLIRLACQAQAEGAVSIVIPPWNGVFGKYLKTKNQPDKEGTESEAVN